MKQVRLQITGMVQGVFFRSETKVKAVSLGITGWVKNEPDGSVSALAVGEEANLRELVEWCKKGPPGAEVDQVKEVWEDLGEEFEGFEIRY